VLNTITRNYPYSRVFFRLADIMNRDTWLTQLAIDSSKEKEGRIRLELAGFSYSNEELGNFMNQFSDQSLFKDVQLKYAKETKIKLPNQLAAQPVRLIQFGIECRIDTG
jgi:hypothetical protein